uniref:Lectin/glucanase superfamily protein n=1 Tax=viral metagenome TaxID=1070528 RepID=A0A6C0M1X2_9ZZZZ
MNILTILIFILIVVLIYVVYKLMSKTTKTVSGFSDASKSLSVPCAKFGASANYGYSVWIYVDSWITSSSDTVLKKNILTRCKGSTAAFNLFLDNAQNNLKLLMSNNTAPCEVKNIKLQKWVNITMSVYGNTVDLYLDGKLVRTCVLTAMPDALDASETLFVGGAYTKSTCAGTSDGDLSGYISNVVYKPDYFTPEEAWNIYSAGYSGAGMFDFVNRYKLSFSVLKDDQTVGNVTV